MEHKQPPESPDGRLIALITLIILCVNPQVGGVDTAYALYYDARSNASVAASTYYGLVPGFNATAWYRKDPPEYRLWAHFPISPIDLVTDSRYFDLLTRIPETMENGKFKKSRVDFCNLVLTNFGILPEQIIWVNTTWIKTTPGFRDVNNPPMDFIMAITGTTRVTVDKTSRFYYSKDCALLIKYWNPYPNFVMYDDYSLVPNGDNVYLLKSDINLNKDFQAINASSLLLPKDFCGYLCRKAQGVTNILEDINQYPQKLGEQRALIGECFWNPAQTWECDGRILGYLPTLSVLSKTGGVSQSPLSAFNTEFDIRYKGTTFTFTSLQEAEKIMKQIIDDENIIKGLSNLKLELQNIITKLIGSGLRDGIVNIIKEEMDVGVLSDWKPNPTTGKLIYLGVIGFALCLIIVALVLGFALCGNNNKSDVNSKVMEELGDIQQ